MIRKMFKRFVFTEEERTRLSIGADARLHPREHTLLLKAGANGSYPTDDDIQIATWLSVPASVKKWLLFEALASTPSGTSLGYRLSDNGVDPLYWDGGSWRAPVGSEWNTEAEVNAGIESFPVSNKGVQIIINLKTTSVAVTPTVNEVRLAYDSDVFQQEDYVRSLIRLIKAEVRPVADYMIPASGPTTEVDLNAIETTYNITAADSAFDHTSDPDHQTDILGGYDPSTKIVTLSSPVADGDTILVRFKYVPEVALTTSQDYTELSKVPVVIVEDVRAGKKHRFFRQMVLDRGANSGLVWDDLYQVDLDVPLRFVTDKAVDQQRLADELKAMFANNVFLVSLATDERYRLWLIDEYDQLTFPSQSELHSGRIRARVAKALFSPLDARPVTGVTKVTIAGGNLELEAP